MTELYRRYRDELYAYLCYLTRDSSLSEDLLQEAFLKAFRGILRFENRASLRTWLFTIARRCYFDWLRKNRQTLPLEQLPELTALEDVQEEILAREERRRAQCALQELTPRSRQAVQLRCSGLPFAEIGRALGISENSARVLYHRAVKRLRDTLGREETP